MFLRFAFVATQDGGRHAFADLRRMLSRAGGPAVEPIFLPSYAALCNAMKNRLAEIAWCPPLVARGLMNEDGAHAVATVVRHGSDHYYSAIVTSADSAVRELSDLEVARMGWVSPLSAAGYVVPREYLESIGIRPIFRQELFFDTHARLSEALSRSEVDVVATVATRLASSIDPAGYRLPKGLSGSRILGTAGPISGEVIVVSETVERSRARALGSALRDARMDPDGPLATLMQATGFGLVSHEHFEALDRF